ncbi:hypothetical protein J2T56_001308 [Natronobacillus azotifigens]|uniref:Zinc-ribbon domain-containing protein n=1 Tax=Natronobacillus azotifigens TaxID=472978 RepID=A0A9J6RBB7_9BACI|nr:zinc-ribbon domain-containing protein [Natronobacillus azotifigens]MCZ0702978.1 zinc-ribbon domain-containing protein [Natronobacillus azotifigens]
MHCPNCNASLDADAKFCTSCGSKITDAPNQLGDQAKAGGAEQEPVQNNTAQTPQTPAQPNPQVEQVKKASKDYWNFLPSALLHPFATSKKMTDSKSDMINGIITLVLFSLFVPFFSYFAARNMVSNSLLGSFYTPTFMDYVVTPFFLFLIFFAVLIGIKFGVAQLMKAPISYVGVLTRFASMLVLPTALAALGMLFALLGGGFGAFLIALAMSFASIASMATLFSIKETSGTDTGLDIFYGIVLTYVGVGIFILIVGDIFIAQIIDSIPW